MNKGLGKIDRLFIFVMPSASVSMYQRKAIFRLRKGSLESGWTKTLFSPFPVDWKTLNGI